MPAPDSIIKLCETFADHREHFRSGNYNEAQLRQEFLDPFFSSLGWDMDNARGLAPQYRDVLHEDALKIGMHTKAPDYAFTIHGQRKFFLEAKKPSVNIRGDIAPAYQLRRYAWSAKLPLSILSDFEEFAIYDTRVKPAHNDPPSKARTFYCTSAEYAEKWDAIAAIFSRDAILRGSFDKYADSSGKKKGTAEVDAAFLGEIERWRELLARNFALRNPSLPVRDLNFAVQKTIDRLVFLRICEDRGTEDYARLLAVSNGANCYQRLLEIFRRADERYNSGLFHFSNEKHQAEEPDTITPDLRLDDRALKDIIGHLYYPESPYEFSVLPADILGSVYERFLGKTIRLTDGHQAKIEEKPEVRKAGGVYYTPAYIVAHIVRNTLGRLLDGPDGPIPLAAAAKLKVADIACGSGSFLIQAYQFLLDWHRDRYLADPEKFSRGKNPVLYHARGGEWRLTSSEKKRILLANIHGVDIDASAVEVTKLSLLLKVLEGETDQIKQRDFLTERQRILPDLAANIRCGNSLVGPDFYDNTQMDLLDEDARLRVNVFDWHSAFPDVFRQGGFDCIVGNPPYLGGREWKEENGCQYDFFVRCYEVADYQFDIYSLFWEKGIRLLRPGGSVGFITPNTWFNNQSTRKLRQFILANTSIYSIADYSKIRVFADATVLPVIAILDRCPSAGNLVKILTPKNGELALSRTIAQSSWALDSNRIINTESSADDLRLRDKIEAAGNPLETCADVKFGIKLYETGKGTPPQKAEAARDHIFESKLQLDSSYRRYLEGKDIAAYVTCWQSRWLKYGPNLAAPRDPALFEGERLLFRRIVGERLIGTLVREDYVTSQLLQIVKPFPANPTNALYLLGVLNSGMMAFYFRARYNRRDKTFPEIRIYELRSLPIRPIDFSSPDDVARHDRMVALVERMLDLVPKRRAEKNPQTAAQLDAQIAATDRQIDRLVYDLYGLTDEEVRLVGGA
jgi:hypothetical protein